MTSIRRTSSRPRSAACMRQITRTRTSLERSAIQVHPKDGRGAVIVLGFPFETITTPHIRAAVMKYVLDFFQAK